MFSIFVNLHHTAVTFASVVATLLIVIMYSLIVDAIPAARKGLEINRKTQCIKC